MKSILSILRYQVLIVAVFATAGSSAQNIRFNFADGNSSSFPLSEVRKITFEGTTLNLHLNAGSTEAWDVNLISSYTFDDGVGMPDVSTQLVSDMKVFPNPSSGAVSIDYTLSKPGILSLEVYDLKGVLVKQLVNSNQASGRHTEIWDRSDAKKRQVVSGTYICRLSMNGQSFTQTLVLQ